MHKVSGVVDESSMTIDSTMCHSCVTLSGGLCKHTIAFLYWLLRCTDKKSTTETICYRDAPRLRSSNRRYKYCRIINLSRKNDLEDPKDLEDVNSLIMIED